MWLVTASCNLSILVVSPGTPTDELRSLVIDFLHLNHIIIMHRFWKINEMVRFLAADLKGDYTTSTSAVTLACCSKRLEDIVLDSLWEHLADLRRLMRCLPPDTWEIHNGEFVRTTHPSPPTLGSSLVNRFSYVVPPSRNGADSRAMLV